ncbi:glyoxylate/hydroxypyruvate reductase A [Bradyrhizobium sp. CB1015]|uniref:2-hydroxyacid dehydrogenase n=1 Tax=Bradyrhizobium sp. CB1015 TaxID=2976822 RepID=UPI0021A9B01B|nr:glyoxylate/hydroxypyruvate reductase A [Bradyrhizobium sp. CB1015]UWU95682.1 glyoxylate/hydroxypyruvate reductase A [Bradyrhizobium sp. CB1015]
MQREFRAEKVRYLLTWNAPDDLSRYCNLEVLFSIGAGVDQFKPETIPGHVKLVRMFEDGIVRMMQEYVVLGVLMLHREMLAYWQQQSRGVWQALATSQASDRRVGFLGLGMLAQAATDRLRPFRFSLAAWSRSEKVVEGVTCFHGEDQLGSFLHGYPCLSSDPDGANTRHPERKPLLSPAGGSELLHVGRGPQLDQGALVAALDSCHLAAAMLDVTDPEPLPETHPLWCHPKVIITPHIASVTQPHTAAQSVVENIRRHRAGRNPIGLVDRTLGY